MNAIEDRLREDLPALADALTNTNINRPKQDRASGDTFSLDARTPPATRRQVQPLVAAAALLVVVAGLVSIAMLRSGTERAPSASAPADPPGPLFVLPGASSGITLANGSVTENQLSPDQLPLASVTIATETDGVYSDVAMITTTTHLRGPGDDWEDRSSRSGPIKVSNQPLFTVVAQQREAVWVTVQTAADRVEPAIAVVESTTVSADGSIQLDNPNLKVLERSSAPLSSETSTYAEVVSPEVGGDPIVVETATSTQPLVGAVTLGGTITITSTAIGNQPGWALHRDDADGEWNGVTWQATPSRIVAVSAHAPLADIMIVAESLLVVDEHTWRAAVQP